MANVAETAGSKKEKSNTSVSFKIMTVVGVILLVVLLPLLTCNVTLIVKSLINPDEVPDFMGWKPFIVLSGSMEPTILLDDLVLTKEITTEEIDALPTCRLRKVEYTQEQIDAKETPTSVTTPGSYLKLDTNNNPQAAYVDGNGNIVDEAILDDSGREMLDETGAIIAYRTSEGSVVTHRIIDRRYELATEDDKAAGNADEKGYKLVDGEKVPYFIVKGDNNNVSDNTHVTYDMVEGIYKNRFAKVGAIAMFLQKPLGLVIFVGAPLLLFILWDVVRRKMYEKKESDRLAEIEAEEEALRLQREAEMQAEIAAKEAALQAELDRLRAAAGEAPPTDDQ